MKKQTVSLITRTTVDQTETTAGSVQLPVQPSQGDLIVVGGWVYKFLHELAFPHGTQIVLNGLPVIKSVAFDAKGTRVEFEHNIIGDQPHLQPIVVKVESIPTIGGLIENDGKYYPILGRVLSEEGVMLVCDDMPVNLFGQPVVDRAFHFTIS